MGSSSACSDARCFSMVKEYYVIKCPHGTKCTTKSFQRAACRGRTRQKALDNLVQHPMGSSHHQLQNQVAEEVAQTASITLWDHDKHTEASGSEDSVDVSGLIEKEEKNKKTCERL